ncbi:unnamed protein product [Arctia plantaginis]|uniref:Uncharacterized protein n=1 Tax=Arctia plantaginis TaxID=874455 RepID=A0A8S1AY87_ARCPL|nr:unnamed protein product [Arctia plantaginis]
MQSILYTRIETYVHRRMDKPNGNKRRIGIYLVALVILKLKKLVLTVGYGTETVLIGDMYNTTIDYDNNNIIDEMFTINTKGCIIPLVAGSDKLIRRYFHEPSRPPACQKDEHPLLTSNRTHIITLKENFQFYMGKNKSNIKCCYKSFYRPRSTDGISNRSIDDRIMYSRCKMIGDTLKVKDEFIKVNCDQNDKVIYSKFFIFAQDKMFTTFRADPLPNNQSLYNILIMGLGSLSRKNFFRTLPKTRQVLNQFEALQLKGYNTISRDTFQNMVALLLGVNDTELRNICYPNRFATLDSCPFIWERFKDMGYYTALAEDSTKHGMFNTETFGFRGTPTDYYIHSFISESERVHKKQGFPCMSDKYYFEVLINYIDNLTTKLNTSKLFGLFWESSMSYNHLKYPEKMDDAYSSLIRNMYSSGYLNKTILILLSDHGMNVGDINLIKEGRLEQRLPLVYILMPRSFRDEYTIAFHNLRLNKNRLTSPFDLHNTLVDLLDTSDISDNEIIKRSVEPYGHNRGISLFLKVPLNRTCEMAGIQKKMCSCYKSVKLSVKYGVITRVAGFFSHFINGQLKAYPRCLKLTVNKIITAYELKPVYKENEELRSFMVILNTIPGGGVFKALLQYNYDSQFILVSPLKRLNVNSRNFCVKNEYIKMFCYCKY